MIAGAQLEEGERLLFHAAAPVGNYMEPFEAAVTDQAVYVVGKKTFAVRNPFVVIRIPHGRIQRIEVSRMRPLWLGLLSVIMVVGGGFTTFVMFRGILRGEAGLSSGIPVGVLVVGAVLPWVLRGRRRLTIRYDGRTFVWTPRLTVDAKSRELTESLLQGLLSSCRQVGLCVGAEPTRG